MSAATAGAPPRYRVDRLPEELVALDRWVCFQITQSANGKTKKLPVIPGVRILPGVKWKAECDDPATWRSFELAYRDAEARGLFLAFVFDRDLPYFFLDGDEVFQGDGTLRPDAALLVDSLDTYTEVSASGAGIHIIGRGALPPHCAKPATPPGCHNWETYPRNGGRFCIFTGNTLPGLETVQDRADALTVLFPAQARSTSNGKRNGNGSRSATGTLTDEEIDRIVAWAEPFWTDGRRHHMALYLSGELARQGVSRKQAAAIIERCASDDSDPGAKLNACDDTYDQREAGESTAGWQRLKDDCGLNDDDLAPLGAVLDGFWRRHNIGTATFNRDKTGRNEASAHIDTGTDHPAAAASTTSDAPHLSDLGNAKRLVARHGADLRHCRARHAWFVWDGRRWALDGSGEAERRAKATVLGLYHEAAGLPEDARRALVKHALRSEGHPRIAAMLALAETEPGIPVSLDALDRDPMLLNVANGTIDLRTGAARPHHRDDLITRLVPVDYDRDAACPRWLAFLDRVMAGSAEKIAFLQRAVGYSLTGKTTERCLFILHGGGKNGKSKFLEAVAGIMSDYASRVATDTLMASRDITIPNDIARLKGVRLAFATEGEEGRRLAEAKIKELTGGDTITARFMRGEYFDFTPEFALWLGTNHKPQIRGTDEAIWDRVRLVPFTVRIPENEQDPDLLDKLLAEAPGILAWAVRGCLDWQREGLGTPEEVREATADYRAEMDVLGQFIAEVCLIEPNAHCTAKAIYAAYVSWCEDAGEKPISQQAFGRRLTERGCDSAQFGANRARTWLGIGLVETAP